jgi:Copper amine oxidase N-terminal domain
MKLNRQIIVALVLILILGLSGFAETKAVLGPVHVELNSYGERVGPSRANTVTAFTIQIRLNVNIEVHDWIKIWFPIEEASNDPADICGDPFEIKGRNESPRFVPNQKYFKKYNNLEEKKVGKLYEVLDEHEVNTRFDNCDSCEETEDNCRIIQDPSGLGCWIMGTVLPAVPRDSSERKERLGQMINTTSLGYCGCSDCQGFPIVIQTNDESSYQTNSPVGVQAWRSGYNPINYNFSRATGIISPATPGRYRIRVATRGEPTPVESDSFVLPCSEITKPELRYEQYYPNEKGDHIIKFNTGEGGALDAGNSLINIKFPDCVALQDKKAIKKGVTVNGIFQKIKAENIRIDLENNTLTIISPCNVNNMGDVSIRFADDVFENSCEEPFTVSIGTSSEPDMIESTPLVTTKLEDLPFFVYDIKLSDNQATMPSSYSFSILPSEKCIIQAGDEIKIEFPEGTILPETLDTDSVIVDGNSVTSLKVQDNFVTLTFEKIVEHPSSIKISFLKSAEIINTQKAGGYRLKVTASCNKKASLSEFFAIAPAPLITTLTFKDPGEPDGCNGWYQVPPILSLVCRNPEAKIYLWYNRDSENKHILYSGEKRLSPGSMRPIIHYQAVYGDEKEEPKSVQLFLDTIPPAIEIKSPSEKRFVTRDDIFIMKGERYFIEMLTDGQASHQVTDGVLIKVNDGEYTQILEPETFAVKDRDNIESEWEYEVELEEGENTVTVLGRDQACNEKAWVYTIVKDTSPPEIRIIEPTDSMIKVYDTVTFKAETESDAIVHINGFVASVIKETEGDKAIFAVDLEIEDYKTNILFEAVDIAGNKSSYIAVFMTLYPVKLKLWVNSPKFVINDKPAKDLDPMPTTKSPPLPAKLAGNTYMPVRAVFEALGATVGWDGDERRVDVRLGDVFLQLWVNNIPTAKINGNTVKINWC